ncbi:MAG: PQQ-binding-like beta-propeller repeat protein [Anaerolineae bacterium]|nr:PQQ-binding-like beta-propeller repeat protein [Anaerolineae bacterium]
MNTSHPRARFTFLALLLLILFIGVGCVPTRLGTGWASLRLVDNNILVTYNDRILLVDAGTGRPVELTDTQGRVRTDSNGNRLRWELLGSATQSQFFASPIIINSDDAGADKVALVVDYNGKIFNANLTQACFSTTSGSCIVNSEAPFVQITGKIYTDVASDSERVYLPLGERDVLALDKTSLAESWRFTTQRGVWSAPILIDGTLYFAEMGHEFYAVNAETGTHLWQVDLGGAIAASPTFYDGTAATDYADDMPIPTDVTYDLVNGRFYAGTFARTIVQISMDGAIENVFNTNDWVWSTPKVVDGILYATDLSGMVYALDTNDNLSQIWQQNTGTVGIRARPLVLENYVVVVSQNGIALWLNRNDGSVAFRQEINEETLSDMLYVPPTENRPDGLVIIGTINPNRQLFAFTTEGQQVWLYPPAS